MVELIVVIVTILLAAGVFFMLSGAIGLLRLPDFYTRLHATGKCDTLGEVLIIFGLLLYHIFVYSPGAELSVQLVPVKLLFLICFIFLANPTATHAIMKAAYNTGVKPWKKGDPRM
ncbi:multicomponent Na+:H+ antiporter subunit G [Candidatus Methanophagaceae archaeon]|nr:MAG: multicomponent Na+:H+ antiporter subunit G [Methanophagales archaeon]KAF5432000.1 multicomponent Na+:H+ antiporter subunit G [Methanophagales archaeon]KAF5434660.1 multicomponent Na+:H+ antiporter subunit G [Methanophagales archaeon]